MRRSVLVILLGLALQCTAVAQESNLSGDSTNPPSSSEERAWQPFGETHRFLFFAVLEGLYEDGVSSADIAQMLRIDEGQSYDHFIANCPICDSVLQAMQVYAARFEIGTKYKGESHQEKESTFGLGLSEELQVLLASEEPETRLKAIYQLISTWFNRRLQRAKLSDEEHARLMEDIEAGKARGLRLLQGFKKQGEATVQQLTPAYVNVDACAMCSVASNAKFHGLDPMGLAPKEEHPFRKKETE